MAVNIQELAHRPEGLSTGHRACPGCGGAAALRQVALQAGPDTVVAGATGCLEVCTSIFPYTAWKVPFIHSAFENSAATISGVETAYRAMKKRGDLPVDRKLNFIAFGGDGGTYDIGLQSLSGAMERGHDMVYICYDNEAYMNTGIQRSSATPLAARTSTTPVGSVKQGREGHRKDLTKIMVAHNIPYVAQTTVFHWKDFHSKLEKALAVDGPAFICVLAPCAVGWGMETHLTMELARDAVDCNFWPLFEVEDGVYKMNKKRKGKLPLVDWLKPQARFKHLFAEGNEHLLVELQRWIDAEWDKLTRLATQP